MISGRFRTIFYLSCLFVTAPLWAAQNHAPVQQGMSAFKRGAYREALQYFTQAERDGNRDASLEYNIAVCLYRLQNFKEARTRFIKLSKIPKWRDLAHYNLGLVAEAAGEHQEAAKWYRLTVEGQSGQLRLLAERKLMRRAGAPPGGRSWMTMFSFGLGRDSNAASLADEMQAAANAGDGYSEWLAYTQTYLSGRAADGLRLYALGFERSYEDFSSLDSQIVGLGLVNEFSWRGYNAQAGIRLTRTLVDSELVSDQLQASLGISRPFASGTFSLAYLPGRYFSGDRYSQVDGLQQRLEAGWARRFDSWMLETRYRFETNDREDLRRGDSFSSYSPKRHGILGKLERNLGGSLILSFLLEYTRSDYSGENRLRDIDGEVKQAARSNEQSRAAAALRYNWNESWRLRGEYEYFVTEDTFDLYSYDKNRFNATVEYQF